MRIVIIFCINLLLLGVFGRVVFADSSTMTLSGPLTANTSSGLQPLIFCCFPYAGTATATLTWDPTSVSMIGSNVCTPPQIGVGGWYPMNMACVTPQITVDVGNGTTVCAWVPGPTCPATAPNVTIK